jgi:hypothetical protein
MTINGLNTKGKYFVLAQRHANTEFYSYPSYHLVPDKFQGEVSSGLPTAELGMGEC